MKIISRARDCNITKFETCAFDNPEKDYSVLIVEGTPTQAELEKAFEKILTEYYDLSGQHQDIQEMELLRRLKILESRNQAIDLTIAGQTKCVEVLGEPMTDMFDVFMLNGYDVVWSGNKEKFIKQLRSIQVQETSYKSEQQDIKAELDAYYEEHYDRIKKRPTSNRVAFLKMINNLELFGRRIDFDTLSVERLALMVKDYRDLQGNGSQN